MKEKIEKTQIPYSTYQGGGAGDDLLYGGPGDDFLHGGHGNDTRMGTQGDDLLDDGGYKSD